MKLEVAVRNCLIVIVYWIGSTVSQAQSPHYTINTESAAVYGVHEINVRADIQTESLLDVTANLVITSPTPSSASMTIPFFYDGDQTWKARVYITHPGEWTWTTRSAKHPDLDNQTGRFTADTSDLPGKLRRHSRNPTAFMTEQGSTFLNIADTAYYLFNGHGDADNWQAYIREEHELGIRLLRALSVGDFGEGLFVDMDNHDVLNMESFKRTDERLIWMLNHYPDIYVEFILFQYEIAYKKDEQLWASLTQIQKERILRQYVARYSAFPQIVWEIHNDLKYEPGWNNTKAAKEIGQYLDAHDPWDTLITTGAYRNAPFPFPDEPWVGFIHLETLNGLPADEVKQYRYLNIPVMNGEDRYEEYRGPEHPQYYYRRLMWSWLLSGGSATYGSRWHRDDGKTLEQPLTPYSQTAYTGLHSVKYIRPYFEDRNIDLALFSDADHLVKDMGSRRGSNRPQAAINGNFEIMVYHPNSSRGKGDAIPDAGVYARIILKLNQIDSNFKSEWFSAVDAKTSPGGLIKGNQTVLMTSPWPGEDVVLRLVPE